MNDVTSGFDPDTFLHAAITEESKRRPPIPAGLSLPGTLGTPTSRKTEGKKETNMGQTYVWVDVPIEIDLTGNPSVRESVGQDKVTLRYSFGLDMKPSGGLDLGVGKNNGLRILRDAVGLNVAGQPFMIDMVAGRQVLCRIGNR